MKKLVAGICTIILMGACGDGSSSGGGNEERSQSSLACDHFRNMAADVSDGVLTDSEIREKLKEVDENASIATPEVQEAARGMLSAITAGDYKALGRETRRMDAACQDAGS